MRAKALAAAVLTAAAFTSQAATGDPGAIPAASLRAQVTAVHQALLSSSLGGTIAKINFQDGASFKKGDVLVEYDCDLQRAQLARAQAAEAAAAGKLRVARDLQKLKSISIANYEEARANAMVGGAETRAARAVIERCKVTAPYSGRVGETYVRANEYVGEGQKLLSVYDDSAFEVQALLPSRDLVRVKAGTKLLLRVEETGKTYAATVERLSGVIDPVSQSVRVTAKIAVPEQDRSSLMPGMSGTVQLAPTTP